MIIKMLFLSNQADNDEFFYLEFFTEPLQSKTHSFESNRKHSTKILQAHSGQAQACTIISVTYAVTVPNTLFLSFFHN